MIDLVLSLVMLAALALVAGAFVLWRRTGAAKAAAADVAAGRDCPASMCVIWTLPTPGGEAPVSAIRKQAAE
ncbi:MAG: hypothetical protein KatS3mg120_0517 [Erythrobacter sp.]|nr:MAG: hypothetical protein KatS3mg120_0517 [Erythrobacter sp.]